MIKINLALRKQSGINALPKDKKPLFAFIPEMPKFESGGDGRLRKAVIMAVFAVAATYFSQNYQAEELAKAEAIGAQLAAENTRLNAEYAKMKSYEQIKKQLEADEATIRAKITTLQKLLAERQAAPKMFLSLSSVIPADVWLAEMKLQEGGVSFRGNSTGFNQISDFMHNLNESAYFSDVNIVSSVKGRDDVGLEAAVFELSAKRRQ